MLFSVAWTALLMGLVGGPHCLAMCAAPCGAVVGAGTNTPPEQPVHWQGAPPQHQRRVWAYHLGRLLGYAAVGALAAVAMQSLAWLTVQSAALRPAWTMLHVGVLAWGLMMVVLARQPAWVEQTGRSLWQRVRPVVAKPGGVFATGFLWALMPCGLLYSALLVASLSGSAVSGAITMALFAVGSGLWLVAGPWLWLRLRQRLKVHGDRGTRLAGILLCGVALWALWLDATHGPELWCS
ncbi:MULTISPECIES: sulfite exporter TauE/SafE family protein [Giesbergeria]|uniref:Sulfite exporter TauE/SafE family protein n=1 Tax=Giesbergeria sinuosa TaxID=80883 RepID=A0ABV9Q988_9BURK